MNENPIRPLEPEDLDEITHVHTVAFSDSLLTVLGPRVVRRYYEWQLTGPHDCVAIGAWAEGALTGFCFAGRFRGAMSGFVARNRGVLLRSALAHPIAVMRRWRGTFWRSALGMIARVGRRSPDDPMSLTPVYGILAIAVDPSAARRGIGRRLMESVETHAAASGVDEMELTVRPDNSSAIAFYESLGFKREPGAVVRMTKSVGSSGYLRPGSNRIDRRGLTGP